ncbi:MAG TPA: chromate resistance protein ChrB domain-containing protein [Stellaceae bacterium]|nr:chromate resistance protein ChrB domain-containing protein [Stellaceae bacterium]
MDGQKPSSISPRDLYGAIGTSAAPLVFDVRRSAGFDADDRMLVGALRRVPGEVGQWAHELPAGRSVVVYCQQGHEVSQEATAALQGSGIDACYLEGGIAGWAKLGLPLRSKRVAGGGKWVTRERPKIDRIACPWLIRRFIEPEAAFLFAPTERVFAVAAEKGATAYDIPGAEPFSHDGELCSFDAFLKVYGIADPALDLLAVIVRGADTARLGLAPQSPGLLALSLGLAANFADDHEMLEHGMVMYDAFYAWCRSLQGETHGWNPELGR